MASSSTAWTPLSLGSKLLAWYSPKDIATLYQTDDTSTPVTTNGQSVGRISDKSGNGYHLFQATGANRPVYNTTGLGASSPSIDFDGTNDYLWSGFSSAVSLGTTDKLSASTVMSYGAGNTHGDHLVSWYNFASGTGTTDDTQNAAIVRYTSVVGGLDAARNSAALSSFVLAAATRARIISEFNGTNHVLTANGSAQTGAASTGNFATTGDLIWGCGAGGGSPAVFGEGKCGALVFTKTTVLSAGDITSLDAYLAAY